MCVSKWLADGLAHGALVDSATALAVRRRGMLMVPTLTSLADPARAAAQQALAAAVGLAHRRGVRLVFGTDAGVPRHGENAQEFVALVRCWKHGSAGCVGRSGSVRPRHTSRPQMVPEVLAFAQVSTIVVALVGSLATIGVVTARAVQRARHLGPTAPPSEARLAQLQESMDAIALDVERIAEAQRFSARLLAEQVAPPTLQR